MDGSKGIQRNSEFNKVTGNQRVGRNPNLSSKIPSTAIISLVMSTCLFWVYLVVFYEESLRELFNMSVFTRKLFLYHLSNKYFLEPSQSWHFFLNFIINKMKTKLFWASLCYLTDCKMSSEWTLLIEKA